MKHARLLVLGIAIGAGLLAARMVMSSRAPEQPAPVQAEVAVQPTVPVLIVTRDVKPGELLQPHDLKWTDWPRDVVPAGAITRDQQPEAELSMAGQIAKTPLYNGEPVREQRLITAANGYMASVLPKGMRAIAVSVETETMAGGFILPGNKVDVILTRTVQGSATTAVSETILQNVRVLAIDAIVAGERDVKILEPERTATLELSPEQAEMIAQAQQLGKIALTLRSAQDSADGDVEDTPRRGNDGVSFVRYGVSSNGAGQ